MIHIFKSIIMIVVGVAVLLALFAFGGIMFYVGSMAYENLPLDSIGTWSVIIILFSMGSICILAPIKVWFDDFD